MYILLYYYYLFAIIHCNSIGCWLFFKKIVTKEMHIVIFFKLLAIELG